MSFESRIIAGIALMYSFFGLTQYLTTSVFIAPFLLNAFLLFVVADFFFFKHLILTKKFSYGLFFFAAFATVNLINDQWFMALVLKYSDLSDWFTSREYYIVQIIGILFLIASLVVMIRFAKRLNKVFFIIYLVLSSIFVCSLFFETTLPPELVVFAIGILAVVANYKFFENQSVSQTFFTLNSLWFLLALLNFFELLSLGF